MMPSQCGSAHWIFFTAIRNSTGWIAMLLQPQLLLFRLNVLIISSPARLGNPCIYAAILDYCADADERGQLAGLQLSLEEERCAVSTESATSCGTLVCLSTSANGRGFGVRETLGGFGLMYTMV